MYKQTLIGEKYTVHVQMRVDSYTSYSRGDHGMGGGERQIPYGTGEVTIRDHAGQAIAVLGLGYGWTNARGMIRAVSEEVFKHCVEVEGLLPDRQKAYADWLAEKWIECFRNPNPAGGMPRIGLTEPDRTELIQCGFVLDPSGQAALLLHDPPSPANA